MEFISFREKKDHKQYLKDGRWCDTDESHIESLWSVWVSAKDIIGQGKDDDGYIVFAYIKDVEIIKSLMN